MSQRATGDFVYELTCPHCRKAFQGQLLVGSAARYHGFKCSKCKLFVPYERVAEQVLVQQPG